MAVFRQICALIFVLLVGGGVGQGVFLERPVNQRVELGSSVRLNCTVNQTLTTSLPVWRLRGSILTPVPGEIVLNQGFLLLPNVTWRHIGEYSCVVTVDGNSSAVSATVNITGYEKPYVQAEQGVRTINHNVGEDLKVECPITGNPGPSIFHWESVDSGQTVTGDTGVETGVFVDEDGSLDVSRVTTAGSQLFDCVGEDAAGNSAGYRIRVISVDPEQGEEEELDLKEWYFILTYCVGGVLVVGGVAVMVVVCWLHGDQCCERVATQKLTRLRVRKSRVKLGDMELHKK